MKGWRELLRRAAARAALTPAERALLRLAEGLLCAGLVAAAPVVAQALGQQSVRWGDIGRAALAAAATAVLLALAKYARAGRPAAHARSVTFVNRPCE